MVLCGEISLFRLLTHNSFICPNDKAMAQTQLNRLLRHFGIYMSSIARNC
jgi:hypothetical protein